MPPGKLENKIVVVTGASGGVGRAIARRFSAEGAKVALIARDLVGLEDTASEIRIRGGQAMVLPLDVSDARAVERAAERVVSLWGRIDVWVNDALVSVFAPVHQTSPDEYRRVMEVNFLGYVHGTLAALKHMRARNAGVIVQIGSAIAGQSIRLQSACSASKAAVRGFTDALRSELIREGSEIQVTNLQLPAVNAPQFDAPRNKLPEHAPPAPPSDQPEAIAGVALRAVLRPRREIWMGWSTTKAIGGQRLVPRFLGRFLGRYFAGKRGVVTRGLFAGAAGTLVLALSGLLERALRGRRPVYAPASLARRLFGPLARTPVRAMAIGTVMRWVYGPLIGVVYGATVGRMVRRRWPAGRPWPAGLALGGAVYLFELLFLPLVGATGRLSRWPSGDKLLLAGHTGLFGLATDLTFRSLEPA